MDVGTSKGLESFLAFLRETTERHRMAEVSLLRAVEFIAGPELPAVTPEQVGVYKALKLAVEYNKFLRKLEAEGRSKYTIGELADEVVLPIWKL